MIFPELGPQYYDEKDRPILSRMEASYAESITINQASWSESDQDTRFYANDQTLWSDLYGNTLANRRRQFYFNRMRRTGEMIYGYQCRNRKSTVVVPRENGNQQTADQLSNIMLWLNEKEHIYETISQAFLGGAIITGMNFLHVWLDYRQDPINGDIKVDNCAYNSFLVDPFFKKLDMSDCNFIWKRSYLTKRECISLFPDRYEEILGLYGSDQGSARDGKFQFSPESYNWSIKNLLSYDEYYYKAFRPQKMLVDTKTGEVREWFNTKDEERLKYFLQAYPDIEVIEQEIPTVNLAIVIQGKVFYHGGLPTGSDNYPFVPVIGYYFPELPYWPYRVQGVMRALRDAQYLYNRRRIIELDILESQTTSGFIYKENALVNPKDVYLSGQGRGIALKEDAQMSDVIQIQPPNIPPSMIQLSELLSKEIQEISGVNEELLGSAVDDKAGILSMLRQGSGLTTLQRLFDNLDTSQKILGNRIMELIQKNYTPGKVKRILQGEEPTPYFYQHEFGTYDCVVEEGLNTATQKQMYFAQLLHLREAGVPIPTEELLDASTLQNKKKLIDAINKTQQQQAQAQQMQLQATLEEQQARTKLAHARAVADEGLGVERYSRVQENQALAVERRAAAVKDEEIGLLNFVKALKEMDTLDLGQIEKLIQLQTLIKQQENVVNQPSVSQEPMQERK